jgi:hypothetical protein
MSSYEGLPPFILEVKRDEGFIKKLAMELDIFVKELDVMVKRLGGTEEKVGKEELAPKECPERPGDTMTVAYCDSCSSRLVCAVWK